MQRCAPAGSGSRAPFGLGCAAREDPRSRAAPAHGPAGARRRRRASALPRHRRAGQQTLRLRHAAGLRRSRRSDPDLGRRVLRLRREPGRDRRARLAGRNQEGAVWSRGQRARGDRWREALRRREPDRRQARAELRAPSRARKGHGVGFGWRLPGRRRRQAGAPLSRRRQDLDGRQVCCLGNPPHRGRAFRRRDGGPGRPPPRHRSPFSPATTARAGSARRSSPIASVAAAASSGPTCGTARRC